MWKGGNGIFWSIFPKNEYKEPNIDTHSKIMEKGVEAECRHPLPLRRVKKGQGTSPLWGFGGETTKCNTFGMIDVH